MLSLLQKLSVIPDIYKGRFIDMDREINLAYQKYPFPWPSEKQYDRYSLEDILAKKRESETLFKEFMRDFHVDEGFFAGKAVLDLGAGVGWDAIVVASAGAKSVCAVDNSLTSVEHGRRFAQQLNLSNVHMIRSSLYDIGRLELSPDVIIAKGVLHHVFDLPRLAGAIRRLVKPGTELLVTHSRYSTRLGFYKYFNNHLAWVLGGADIEKRIDAGIRLFRGWTRKFPPEVIRDRTNDLAGVFYMARSARKIKKIFEDQGFKVETVPNNTYLDYYPSLGTKLQDMIKNTRSGRIKKAVFVVMLMKLRFFSILAARCAMLNRGLGHLFTVLFFMPPHKLKMVALGDRRGDTPQR